MTDGFFSISVPSELLEQMVERVAERVLAELSTRDRGADWPEWMSVVTAARYLDVSEERVRKLVAARVIPFAQEAANCRISFSRRDLDDWMATFRQGSRGSRPS